MKKNEKDMLLQQMGDFAAIFAQPQDVPQMETGHEEEPATKPQTKANKRKPTASDPHNSRAHGGHSEGKGRTDKPLCIAVDTDIMRKVRVILYKESGPTNRCTLKYIVDDALRAYIARYESKHGKIEE